MKNINITLGNKSVKVGVKETVSCFERGAQAALAAKTVVDGEDGYRPWMKDFCCNLALNYLYTDLDFPEGWHDEDVEAFFAGEEWAKLRESFPAKEVEEFWDWYEEEEEMLKRMKFNSGSVVVGTLMKVLTDLKEELDKRKEKKV